MKLLKQDIDWHIYDVNTNEYLGEVFGDGDETKLWIKPPAEIPTYFQRHVDFSFFRIDNDGYIIIPTELYNAITVFVPYYITSH